MTQPLWKGFGIFLLGFTQGFPAVQIPAEVPSMDSLMNPTASTAIASPVVWWERPADQSGVWGRTPPSQIDDPDWGTLLSNQELPIRRWAFPEPGIRIQVGNEVGDYLLQEAAEGPNPTNRTPTIETWVASPIWHGAQAFAELRQVDHFGEALRTERAQAVGSENMDDPDGRFAWFGENYPGYSSLRGGLSLQGAWGTGNLMVGQEYLWLLGAGDQWYGIKSQRIQAFLGSENLSAQMVVDSLTLQQDSLEGGQSLWRGRLQWQNGCCLAASAWRVRGGFDLIGVSTSGDYPYRTDARVRALPWIALRIPFRGAEFSGWAGRNNDDWRWSDTLRTQWRFLRMEARTDAGTREQPLGMDEERLDSLHSICLRPSTGFWLQDLLLHTEIESGPVQIQISLQPWIQHGALAAWHSGDDSLQRISGRIGGLRKKAEFVFQPSERNSLHVGLTHENRQGDWDDLEWQPSQLVLWAGLECHLPTGMRIGHVWQYQSVMRWNTIADSSVHISGRWVWNAIVHQDFENGFELEANWIHVLLGGDAEVPGQNLDRTRFMCHLGWRF